MRRSILSLIALALFAADATAGPLARLRQRRAGGCAACGPAPGCTPSYAPHAFAAPVSASGCASGACPVRR